MNRWNGPAHPTTLMVRANLSGTLNQAGDRETAEALLLENLELVREADGTICAVMAILRERLEEA